jgi:hypothetical protein
LKEREQRDGKEKTFFFANEIELLLKKTIVLLVMKPRYVELLQSDLTEAQALQQLGLHRYEIGIPTVFSFIRVAVFYGLCFFYSCV